MEMGIFKKIRLISKSGFLASSLLNIGAMEVDNNKILKEETINNINEKNEKGKIRVSGNKAYIENLKSLKNTNKLEEPEESKLTDPTQLLNKEQLIFLLNYYKNDIFPLEIALENTKNAYEFSVNVIEYYNLILNDILKKQVIGGNFKDKNELLNYCEHIIRAYYKNTPNLEDVFKNKKHLLDYCEYIKNKYSKNQLEINLIDLIKVNIESIWKYIRKGDDNKNFEINVLKNEEIKKITGNKFNLLRCLSVNPKETAEKNFSNIGRGICHSRKHKELNIINEYNFFRNGGVNCTTWSELLYYFFNINGYPAYKMSTYNHAFTVIPIECSKTIVFKKIEIKEEIENNIENNLIRFYMSNLAYNYEIDNKICKEWEWLDKTKYNPYDNSKIFNPTFVYFDLLLNTIEYPNLYNCDFSNKALNGLKKIFNSNKEIKKDLKNGMITYPLKFLPTDSNNFILGKDTEYNEEKIQYIKKRIFIPLNLEYIQSSIDKNGKRLFNIDPQYKFNTTTPFLYAVFNTYKLIYDTYIDQEGEISIFLSDDNELCAKLDGKADDNLNEKKCTYVTYLPIFYCNNKNRFNFYKPKKYDDIFFKETKYLHNSTINVDYRDDNYMDNVNYYFLWVKQEEIFWKKKLKFFIFNLLKKFKKNDKCSK